MIAATGALPVAAASPATPLMWIAAALAAATALAWLLRRDYRQQPDRSLSGLATPAWVSLLTLLAGLGMAALLWLASLW
ncbi:hypothetical protein C7E17_15830 [Stenotrophomonas maltophilia]|nr:hypothetical protein C7E17_15830 [Stenotrophomonas maltophilia]